MEKNIKNAIKNVLTGLNVFNKVYDSDVSIYEDGYPVAVVYPSENDSDYGSTEADKITFVFKVKLVSLMRTGTDQQMIDDLMYDLGDSVINAFKSRGVLGNTCDWVQPVPSIWGTEDRGDAIHRTREFTIRCKKYVSNV